MQPFPLLDALPPCEERWLTSSVGTKLFVRHWLPRNGARGPVVLVHGIYEHSGRYHHIAERFTRHGFDVWAADHYGHGRSEGARGHILNDNHYLDDLALVIAEAQQGSAEKPIVFGHSMGGAIAALYAVRNPTALRALILSAPALGVHASALTIALGRLACLLAPAAPLPPSSGLRRPATHDAVWEAWKHADPLKHSTMTLRTARFIVDAGEEVRAKAETLRVPVLILLAEVDTYVDNRGARAFFAKLPPGMNELHEYPGFYHEVCSEVKREKPLSEIEAWLQRIGVLT